MLLSALGSIVGTACLFLVYRIVVREAGLAQLGLWSLMATASAVVRIADISGTSALARFVALPGTSSNAMRDTVHTVLLTSLGFNIVLCGALALAAPLLLPQLFAPDHRNVAWLLAPFVIAMTLAGSLATGLMSALDGTQRADLRVLVTTVSSVTLLLASFALSPSKGIVGFAVAQLLQQLVIIGLGWALLRRQIPDLGWLPLSWNSTIFRETAQYALKLNTIGVAVMLFEPAAKVVINNAAGPAAVAIYDIASRLVLQVRGLFVSAAAPLVPAFAAQRRGTEFRELLRKSTVAVCIASAVSVLTTLVVAPVVSVFLFARVDASLVVFTATLAAGWNINLVSVPIYLAAQAKGVLRWNLLGHILAALSVLLGSAFVVTPYGVTGLICAISIGVMASAICNIVGNAFSLASTGLLRSLVWPMTLTVAFIFVVCASAALLAGRL